MLQEHGIPFPLPHAPWGKLAHHSDHMLGGSVASDACVSRRIRAEPLAHPQCA